MAGALSLTGIVVGLTLCVATGTAQADSSQTAFPRFLEVGAEAGLVHVYGGDSDFVVGGGAAAMDCNEDERPDLLLAGGAHPAALYVNDSEPRGPLRFSRADLPSLAPVLTRVTGAYPLDADGDERIDLFLLRFGRNALLRGLGDCRFALASDDVGLPDITDWTTAFAAIWEPGASRPTLAIGNYVDRDRPLRKSGNCQDSYLLRPQTGQRPGYGKPSPLIPSACPLSLLFVDWDRNGRFDLRAANDRAYYDRGLSEQLWRLEADGVRPLGAAEGWRGAVLWGMGLAAGDLDGDLWPEIAVTNMADNHLQSLEQPGKGQARFINRALELGVMSQRPYTGGDPRPSTSWHVDLADFDNDGRLDLWIVKGNVDSMPDFAAYDPDSLLLQQPDGRFVEHGLSAGLASPTRGRGGVAADFNGDGLLDLVVVNRDQPVTLFQAVAAPSALAEAAHWLKVDPRGNGGNSFAVGARVEVRLGERLISRTRTVGGGHAGGSALPLHFGLGAARQVSFRIIWPDGTASSWQETESNRLIRVDRD